MESPLSPIVADLIMQDLESYTLKNLIFIPPFYIRYVDDIAMGEFVYAVTATEGIILSSLFIGRKQR